MTDQERAIARDLGGCRFVPGSWEKRFSRNMSALAWDPAAKGLTKAQRRWLLILHHRFRRQIPGHRCGAFCRIEELPGALG